MNDLIRDIIRKQPMGRRFYDTFMNDSFDLDYDYTNLRGYIVCLADYGLINFQEFGDVLDWLTDTYYEKKDAER